MCRAGTLTAILVALGAIEARATSYIPHELICKLHPGWSISEINSAYGTTTLELIPGTRLYLLHSEEASDMEIFSKSVESHEGCETAHANYETPTPEAARQMPLAAVGGGEAEFEDQGAAQRIGLPDAHQMSLGEGVTLAVIDTGVDLAHARLSNQISTGFDFVDDDADASEESNGVDDDGDGLVDGGFGHGTMVAGIASLVAPAADILPVRVLGDEGLGNVWDAIQGVRFATDAGVDVMNLSFGTTVPVPLLAEEVERARAGGVIVVAAAGNQSTDDAPYHPAADASALMITALDSLDTKADFADWHAAVAVSAPGTGIRSTFPGGGWALGSGCSFATPFVSGEVGLLVSLAPQVSGDWIVDQLRGAVDEIYSYPENWPYLDQLGTGRINVGSATETVGVDEPHAIVAGLRAWPNPSASLVRIRLGTLAGAARARLDVFATTGRLVRSLPVDRGEVVWDGTTAAGTRVAPGVYHLRVTGGAEPLGASVRLVR